jgi:hypothetical protein
MEAQDQTTRSPRALQPPRRMSPSRLVGLAALLLATAAAPLSAQLAVIVNERNAADEISTDRLKRLFLGQATTFTAGDHARLATHAPSSERFDRSALGLSRELVRSRWIGMAFRGEATSVPTDLTTVDDVKRFVREHPDAIAYIPAADVDATVKELRVDGKRPADPGYPIR